MNFLPFLFFFFFLFQNYFVSLFVVDGGHYHFIAFNPQMALNAQDNFVSQNFWSYSAALGKLTGRIKTKVNVFIQDAAWDSGRQELVAHEVVLIIQELHEVKERERKANE